MLSGDAIYKTLAWPLKVLWFIQNLCLSGAVLITLVYWGWTIYEGLYSWSQCAYIILVAQFNGIFATCIKIGYASLSHDKMFNDVIWLLIKVRKWQNM